MDRAGKLLRKLNIPSECLSSEDLVRAAWPQAVGARVAAHTRLAGIERAVLTVEVEDLVWRQQLDTLRGQILPKLQEIAGKEAVRAIEFRLGVPRRPPQRAAVSPDEAERIEDPILRKLYRVSRRKSAG